MKQFPALSGSDKNTVLEALAHTRKPFGIAFDNTTGVQITSTPSTSDGNIAWVPAVTPDALGSDTWKADHKTQYAYYGGEMAQGIASAAICEELSKVGMIGYFGSAGLSPAVVEENIIRLKTNLGDHGKSFGANLINSPHAPELENKIVDLYLKYGVERIGAAAYMQLSLPIVRYRLKGLSVLPDGTICCRHHIAAKISRQEVAAKFLTPAPEKFVNELLASGEITEEQARLSQYIPVADDITAEADSGGHTDNRAAMALFPSILMLRDRQQTKYNFATAPRVGLGGGIASPQSAAAAFAMGADYLVVGSAHQACVESGTSDTAREMLAHATQADVLTAPAGDMFEMGAKVQVLKWGTLFAQRARKLGDWYSQCKSLEDLPANAQLQLERDYFKKPVAQVWKETEEFFTKRDPAELERANRDPKHKMALIFRAYLGLSSRWAIQGDPSNRSNFQIWCGPSMGAFNEWTQGSFLETPSNRKVGLVAMNIMFGAAVLTRANILAAQGIRFPEMYNFTPKTMEELQLLAR